MFKAVLQAFMNLFKPVHTLKYPLEEDIVLPKAYRGLIEYSEDDCIFCDQCEKACPPKAIVFYQHEDGSKEYRYNPYLCIYCGECVRACPKPEEALWQSEKKQPVATGNDEVNSGWFIWQSQAAESREHYAGMKKSAKEKKNDGKKD
jgi:formate hydrogenlyase subunit 6/NADH:ubiquinone oxidoreductase subunit I